MDDRQKDASRQRDTAEQEIDERFIDDEAEGEQEIVDAAARASETDREAPGSAERRERSLGVEDPSHSKGSVRRKD